MCFSYLFYAFFDGITHTHTHIYNYFFFFLIRPGLHSGQGNGLYSTLLKPSLSPSVLWHIPDEHPVTDSQYLCVYDMVYTSHSLISSFTFRFPYKHLFVMYCYHLTSRATYHPCVPTIKILCECLCLTVIQEHQFNKHPRITLSLFLLAVLIFCSLWHTINAWTYIQETVPWHDCQGFSQFFWSFTRHLFFFFIDMQCKWYK